MTPSRIFRHSHNRLDIVCIVCGQFKENTYLVRERTSRRQVLIDAGDNLEAIQREIAEGGLPVEDIILTHGHFDHVDAAVALQRESGIRLNVHENDVRLLRRASIYALSFSKRRVESPKEYLPFDDAAQFALHDLVIEVHPSPGHTAGGVCLHVDGVLFTGDSLLFEHIGPTDYPESSYADLITSVERLLASFPDETLIMPGHGRPWTVGAARKWWADHRAAPAQLQIMPARGER